MWEFRKNKKAPLISVIVPVYNTEKYLKDCLEGIVNQTYQNLEILCINDGSTDGSLAILSEYAGKDERIKVIDQENKGVARARNTGLDHVTGEYITFLDADDFFEFTLYEELASKAVKMKTDICVCRSDSFFDGETHRWVNDHAFKESLMPDKKVFSLRDIPRHSFSVFNGYVWDKLFRADFIKKHQLHFNPTKASSDARFTHMALALAKRIAVVPEILIHHAIERKGALTEKRDYNSFYHSYIGLRGDLKDAGLWGRFEQAWMNRVLQTSMWYLINQDCTVNEEYFRLLKESWIEDLGLSDKDASWFLSEDKYTLLQHVKQMTYEEFAETELVKNFNEQ